MLVWGILENRAADYLAGDRLGEEHLHTHGPTPIHHETMRRRTRSDASRPETFFSDRGRIFQFTPTTIPPRVRTNLHSSKLSEKLTAADGPLTQPGGRVGSGVGAGARAPISR